MYTSRPDPQNHLVSSFFLPIIINRRQMIYYLLEDSEAPVDGKAICWKESGPFTSLLIMDLMLDEMTQSKKDKYLIPLI